MNEYLASGSVGCCLSTGDLETAGATVEAYEAGMNIFQRIRRDRSCSKGDWSRMREDRSETQALHPALGGRTIA
ncbi:UNVERIFIED_CONTAM: hypothetical protein K2H54_013111 [Gekko kuhli]